MLDVSQNALEPQSVQALCTMLEKNQTIRVLSVGQDALTFQSLQAQYTTLGQDQKMQVLDVSQIALGPQSLQALCGMLEKNQTIRVLSIGQDALTSQSAQALCTMLSQDLNLQVLDMSQNALGLQSLQALCTMLEKSRTIRVLSVGGQKALTQQYEALHDMLQKDQKIQVLDMSQNLLPQSLHTMCLMLEKDQKMQLLDVMQNALEWLQAACTILEQNQTVRFLSMSSNASGLRSVQARDQTKGGDAKHMKQFLATYANFTEYVGEMKDGSPHGSGKMTHFVGSNKGKQIAFYTGEWRSGKIHGNGKHEAADGLCYEGEWADGMRHGNGVETMPPELSRKLGYSSYTGEWQYDKFHGKGQLLYADVLDADPKRLRFEGEFKDGICEGLGSVYDRHGDGQEKRLKLRCTFERGQIRASRKDQWTWACLDGDEDQGRDCKYFFGALSVDGTLGSWGTLYSGSAISEPSFLESMERGEFYDEINSDSYIKYTLYHGAFKENLPDGFGLQHFEGARMGNKDDGFHGGTYSGEFLKGKRHGQGTWKSLEGDWEFRPVNSSSKRFHAVNSWLKTKSSNWENDLMHGKGDVEYTQVHPNVNFVELRAP